MSLWNGTKCLGCGVEGELIEVRRIRWCKACGTLIVLVEDKNIVNPVMKVEVSALMRVKKIRFAAMDQAEKDK